MNWHVLLLLLGSASTMKLRRAREDDEAAALNAYKNYMMDKTETKDASSSNYNSMKLAEEMMNEENTLASEKAKEENKSESKAPSTFE